MTAEEVSQLTSALQITQSKMTLHGLRLESYKARAHEERRFIRAIANSMSVDDKRVGAYLEAHAQHVAAEASIMELTFRELEGQVAVYDKLLKDNVGALSSGLVDASGNAARKSLRVPGGL